jgi:hypothetical protein
MLDFGQDLIVSLTQVCAFTSLNPIRTETLRVCIQRNKITTNRDELLLTFDPKHRPCFSPLPS